MQHGFYVKLHHFLVDLGTQLEYTIVQSVFTANSYNNSSGMLQKIVQVQTEQKAILTNIHFERKNHYIAG